MIIKLFINTIYALIYLITSPIRLLPDVSLPEGFISAISNANGLLATINSVVPVDTILTLLQISLIIETAYLSYKMIMWIIKRFPTQS